MTVKLPSGIQITASAQGLKYGQGRPILPDPESAAYKARAEIARAQGSGAGRPTIFADAGELKHACTEYFKWVDQNPLYEDKATYDGKRGKWEHAELAKKRPYTQGALCFYLGIPALTWISWRQNDKFKDVVAEAESIIYHQKFEGAAAGFFKENIIARDLGLADKQEVTGTNGGPIERVTLDMTPEQAAEAYAKTREKQG